MMTKPVSENERRVAKKIKAWPILISVSTLEASSCKKNKHRTRFFFFSLALTFLSIFMI